MSNISSPPLRLELNPSRWLAAAVAALVLLATVAVLRSGMPAAGLIVVALLAIGARTRLGSRNTASLLFRGDGSVARLFDHDEEHALEARALIERGPLAVLVLATTRGEVLRLPCGPDTLAASARRELRLWFVRHGKPARAAHAASQREAAHV